MGIPIVVPVKGRGFIHQGSGLGTSGQEPSLFSTGLLG